MPIQRKSWFQEAENDCTEALNLDDRYIKAYSRRSTAWKELGKLKESIEDAEFALRLEPQNQEIKKQYGEVKALYEKEILKRVSGATGVFAQGTQISGKTIKSGPVIESVSSSPQKLAEVRTIPAKKYSTIHAYNIDTIQIAFGALDWMLMDLEVLADSLVLSKDENGILNSFLFYLFSYDDDYVCVENAFCVDEGCLERKVDVHPNDLTPFLVVPTSSDLITSFLEYLATLKYGNTLDETHVLHTFLYYLFAFDDVHVDV
ncbi:hypothetical protein BC332_25575 [Capsicum chinense]|nr:hypothetical protein BC332_25575 [Capsicum chinense]